MVRHTILSFLSQCFVLFVFFIACNTAALMNQPDLDFMNSPEFSDMMEEFERELAALSPEERSAFDEMMNEFARVIQEMPEEEFNQLLEDINNDMQMAEEMGLFDATETVDVSVAPAVDSAAPVTKIDIPDEIKELAETLQTTKTYLALFLSKIQIAPDLPLKIDKWMRDNKITSIPDGYTWLQCTEDIEKLISLLSTMLETDAKSNPIFLFEIHKDANLEQTLGQLSSILSGVAVLDIAEFGIKQEKEINVQIQNIISELCATMLQRELIQKLQTLSQQSKDATKQLKTEKPDMIMETKVIAPEKLDRFEEFEDFDFE